MDVKQILSPVLGALAADDYPSTVREAEGVVYVDIEAGPSACPECLVPKDFMESILASTLVQAGVTADVRVTYPSESHPANEEH